MNEMISRHVRVDRTRSPKDMLKAIGRHQYVDDTVIRTMPKGAGGEVEVVFFKLDLSKRDGWISDDDLEKEYELRGLKSADPYSQGKVNEDDPTFADEHPNATHWKDVDGRWCYAVFNRWDVERRVRVDRHDRGWFGDWWFAGLRT